MSPGHVSERRPAPFPVEPLRRLKRAAFALAWRPWYRWVGRRARLARPIFIVGMPRSGTTILARLLGQHPDLAQWSEANAVWDPAYYQRRPYLMGRDVYSHRFRPEALTEADRRRIHGMFGFYTRVQGKRRFLNKAPANSMRLPWVKALFPDCVFVHVRRDGRAVVSSRKQQLQRHVRRGRYRWPLADPETVIRGIAETWVLMTREVEDAAAGLKPEDVVTLSYEAFCEDVHGSLRRLLTFCDLDPDRYDWSKAPRTLENRNYKWREMLTPREQAVMLETIRPRLRELGYADASD